jgi:hypothetical protein
MPIGPYSRINCRPEKDPFARNNIGVGRTSDKSPCVVLNKGLELGPHGTGLVKIEESFFV